MGRQQTSRNADNALSSGHRHPISGPGLMRRGRLVNYPCAPRRPVDRGRSGYKTCILISRHEVKDKRDVEEFNIGRGIREGISRAPGRWEIRLTHQTKPLRSTCFPKVKAAVASVLIARNCRPGPNPANTIRLPPESRWRVAWETNPARRHMNDIPAARPWSMMLAGSSPCSSAARLTSAVKPG